MSRRPRRGEPRRGERLARFLSEAPVLAAALFEHGSAVLVEHGSAALFGDGPWVEQYGLLWQGCAGGEELYPVVEVGAESGQGVGPPGAALPVGVDFLGGVGWPGCEVLA